MGFDPTLGPLSRKIEKKENMEKHSNQPNLTKEISNSHPNHQSHHRCRPVAGSDAAGWPLPEFPGAEGRLTPRGACAIF